MIPFPSTSFAAYQLAKCRKLFGVSFHMDPLLASGTYYAIVVSNALLQSLGSPPAVNSPPGNVDLTTVAGLLLFAAPIVHVAGASEVFAINAADYGYPGDTGWWTPLPSYYVPTTPPTPGQITAPGAMFLLSTAAPASYTSAGAHVWTNATGDA